MSKFGLWWVTWNGSDYESRMTVGSRKATIEDFRERGFDRIVFLGSLSYGGPHLPENGTNQYRYNKLQEYVRALCNGYYDWNVDSDNPNKGKSRYDVGYLDGQFLSLWISSRVGTIKYYVPIPFSYGLDNPIRNPLNEKKKYSAPPRDCPMNGFDESYWHGWIDGVLSVVDDYRVGFYWSYESCLQATKHDPNFVDYFSPMYNANTKEYVDDYKAFIRDMSRYIHNRGHELVWIPATGARSAEYLRDSSGIPVISKHFDYVFVQPNYYQYNSTYTSDELVKKVKWIYESSLSIEMEADSAVLHSQSGHCALCKYENNHYVCDNEGCLERACQYVGAILEVDYEIFNREPIPPERATDTLFPDRAYYFGTDFKVVDAVRGRCPEW